MSEVRVVDLKELGVSKEVFDKIYSMGEQDGRADAIDDVISLFESIFEQQNKVDSKYTPTVVINGLIFGALEQLKEQANE